MFWPLLIIAYSPMLEDFQAREAVVTHEASVAFLTNTGEYGKKESFVILDVATREPELSWEHYSAGFNERRSGPTSWGMTGPALYACNFYSLHGSLPAVEIFSARVADQQDWRERRDEQARQRIGAYNLSHNRVLKPLKDKIGLLILDGELTADSWDLYFDVIYAAENHVSLIYVRDGQLWYWTFNKPEEEDWVDRGTFVTEIDSAFRIEQAGDHLYLIDAEGRVFSAPGEGHKQVGSITGWDRVGKNDELILFEDQASDRIGAVVVENERATVLAFAGDERAAEDFVTTITEDLAATFVEMARILREARE